jgi:hypothetical protein
VRVSVRSEERRICAGDWVRLIGSGVSIRGLGKVIDADYDAEDASLRLARVEFARGAHWFWPGDLRRIAADEEIRLCEAALDASLMPEPARERVKAALLDLPRPRTARSLGLLDLLWSLLGSLPGERAVSGLARFFDEGEAKKLAVDTPHPAPRPVIAPVLAAPPPTPRPAAVFDPAAYDPIATTISRPWTERPTRAPAPPEPAKLGVTALVDALLETLNHGPLLEIATKAGVPIDRRTPIATARKMVGTFAELNVILAVLTPNQLQRAARRIGVLEADATKLTMAILERAAPRNVGDFLYRYTISPSETLFQLGLLGPDELRFLARSFDITCSAEDSDADIIARIMGAAEE